MSSAPPPVPAKKPAPAAPRRSNVKWLVIAGVLVVGVGVAFALRSRGGGEEVVPITTEKAVVKTITQLVTATGKIQPDTEVKIAPEVSGEIIELPFREGAAVKKGDLLVRIKPDNFQFQLTQQEAGLVSARASEIDSKVRLDKAAEDFRRNERLYEDKIITDSDFAAAKSAYQSAVSGYESAKANIIRAEGQVNQARDTLSKTTIYAPMDGKIIALNNEVGERVTGTGGYGGADLMRIADLENMELRVRVNENDIVNVRVGNHALVSIDAMSGRRVNGRVTEISNSAVGATGGAQGAGGDDVTNFLVKIGITDRGLELRPGMSATADIETQTVTDVVSVPIQSVTVRAGSLTSEELQKQQAAAAKEKSGSEPDLMAEREQARRERDKLQRVVFVKDGDKVRMQMVETGIADLTHIEVKSGLKAGDEVVSGSYTAITRRLKDGAAVRIETPKAPAAK